jgi:sulfur relay (sulfurtransferase) DsrF/TusC family protein
MASYLLISSRDPFESVGASELFALATSLARAKDGVAVFFVENGVSAAVSGAGERWLTDLAAAGVELFADDFSLRERGIAADRVIASVRPTSLDVVIDALGGGHKVLWH